MLIKLIFYKILKVNLQFNGNKVQSKSCLRSTVIGMNSGGDQSEGLNLSIP